MHRQAKRMTACPCLYILICTTGSLAFQAVHHTLNKITRLTDLSPCAQRSSGRKGPLKDKLYNDHWAQVSHTSPFLPWCVFMEHHMQRYVAFGPYQEA